MKSKNISQKVYAGIKWKTFERLFLQIINALSPMLLARILVPEDFGVIAILTVFISLANTLVHNGLGNSLIQKKESDIVDFSTVCYTQIAIAIICYVVLFFAAPLIAKLYNNEMLTVFLRVMSLSIVIDSLGTMQITIMKKNMDFNKSFVINISSAITYGIVSISMAYAGFGCWSLVFGKLASSIVLALVAIVSVRWHPILCFSFTRLKKLFSYSWKLMVGWLIGTLHQDLYTLVIGKQFNSTLLGFYNRASSFPQVISKSFTEVVDGVMFPALSQIQDEPEKFKSTSRKMILMNSYILFPVFLGLAAVSENLVTIVLTEKWLPSVPMMQIMCLTYALNAINNSNMHIFNSIGRSDIFMKFELIKRCTSVVLLFIASSVSIYAVTLVLLLMAIVSNVMNSYQNNKLINYTFFVFYSDILPSLLMSLIMALCTWGVGFWLHINIFAELVLQVFVGILIYFVMSVMFRARAFREVKLLIKSKRK